MNKILAITLVIVTSLFIFSGCSEDKEPDEIIQGYSDSQSFSDGEDGSKQEFAKYIYDKEIDKEISENEDYEKVTSKNIDEIKGYVENFDEWASHSTFSKDYTFSVKYVTEGDYYCINDKTVTNDVIGVRKQRLVYKMYSVYYYDTETHTLYHIFMDIRS